MAILTPISKKRLYYSDFKTDFAKNPLNDDVSIVTNEDAVKQSIRNLILTDRGERPFQPNLGSDVRAMLFENINPATLSIIESKVETAIRNYEPRAGLISVEATSLIDDNTVRIAILFYIINKEEPVSFNVILTRAR